MHYQTEFVTFEINPVVPQSKSVKRLPRSFKFSKALQVRYS